MPAGPSSAKATTTSGFDASVNATIAALRSKNCPAFIKNSLTNTNNPSECTQTVCQRDG